MQKPEKSRGRGRPRQFDPGQVVSQALSLFRVHGYDGTSVGDICATAGINPPSLYAAFGSKLGLFTQVLEEYLNQVGRYVETSLESSLWVEEAVAYLFLNAAEAFSDTAGSEGCLLMEGARFSLEDGAKDLCREVRLGIKAKIERRVAREHPKDAKRLAAYVMLTLAGLSASAREGLSSAGLKELATMSAEGFAYQLRRAE